MIVGALSDFSADKLWNLNAMSSLGVMIGIPMSGQTSFPRRFSHKHIWGTTMDTLLLFVDLLPGGHFYDRMALDCLRGLRQR